MIIHCIVIVQYYIITDINVLYIVVYVYIHYDSINSSNSPSWDVGPDNNKKG